MAVIGKFDMIHFKLNLMILYLLSEKRDKMKKHSHTDHSISNKQKTLFVKS